MPLLQRLFAFALLAHIAGCTQPTMPRFPFVGTYDLREVSGQTVPLAGPYRQLSGTLTLNADGTLERRALYSRESTGAPEEAIWRAYWRVQVDALETAELCTHQRCRRELKWQHLAPIDPSQVGFLTLPIYRADDGIDFELYERR